MSQTAHIPPGRARLRFDAFHFDLESHELWRSGALVPLAPKPARILAALLTRPGALITREELYAIGWPDTIVSTDLSLNTAIRQIRVALEDSAEQPSYVQTVPRRGYRFIGEVQQDAIGRSPALIPRRPRWPLSRRVRRAAGFAAITATALVAAALATGVGDTPTVSIAPPLPLDETVNPATGRVLEESIRTTVARNTTGVRVLAGGADRAFSATYVVRSFLRIAGSGETRLDVQVVRTADGMIVWSGWFDPHCPLVEDPTAAIADYVARVLTDRIT